MALRHPQNSPVPAPARPSAYDDDLAARCFPHRFRRIGTPYAYLSGIGIDPILEYICKGHLLIDVAEAVDVPLNILREWVEKEGHTAAVDEAETLSAEGYLADGMRRLKTAQTEFELRRAKEMIRHAQYMASKKNKPVYGESTAKQASAPVTYIFNVPSNDAAMKTAGKVIEATAKKVEQIEHTQPQGPVSLDLGEVFGYHTPTNNIFEPLTSAALAHLEQMDDAEFLAMASQLGQQAVQTGEARLVLVADRPENPTPQQPDIGPFYEEQA